MSICQAENGFSLDKLVKKLADAFENKAFADILKMNLQLTQEVLMYRIFNNSSSQKCCPDGHLTLNGSFERRIRTSLCEFKMDFWRVSCSKCGKTFAPSAVFCREEALRRLFCFLSSGRVFDKRYRCRGRFSTAKSFLFVPCVHLHKCQNITDFRKIIRKTVNFL